MKEVAYIVIAVLMIPVLFELTSFLLSQIAITKLEKELNNKKSKIEGLMAVYNKQLVALERLLSKYTGVSIGAKYIIVEDEAPLKEKYESLQIAYDIVKGVNKRFKEQDDVRFLIRDFADNYFDLVVLFSEYNRAAAKITRKVNESKSVLMRLFGTQVPKIELETPLEISGELLS